VSPLEQLIFSLTRRLTRLLASPPNPVCAAQWRRSLAFLRGSRWRTLWHL